MERSDWRQAEERLETGKLRGVAGDRARRCWRQGEVRLETGKRRKVSVSVCNWVWACLGVCARASVSLVCLQVRACVCVCVSVCLRQRSCVCVCVISCCVSQIKKHQNKKHPLTIFV